MESIDILYRSNELVVWIGYRHSEVGVIQLKSKDTVYKWERKASVKMPSFTMNNRYDLQNVFRLKKTDTSYGQGYLVYSRI